MQFIASFRGSERCGACSPGGYEGYLLPASPLSARLCATAHVAAEPKHKRSVQVRALNQARVLLL